MENVKGKIDGSLKPEICSGLTPERHWVSTALEGFTPLSLLVAERTLTRAGVIPLLVGIQQQYQIFMQPYFLERQFLPKPCHSQVLYVERGKVTLPHLYALRTSSGPCYNPFW